MNRKIALTRSDSKFHNYRNWVESGNIPYEVLDWEQNNFDDIKRCSALLLTGGVDIFPEFYNDWEDGKHREDYIPERDGFEFRLLEYALDNNFPVLGICRGLQLINCKLNGSLISDIETIRGTNHRKVSPTEDRMHDIKIKEGSLLSRLAGSNEAIANSSHHQAIDRLGEGLVVTARADDGIIEAVEWQESGGKPFFLGIQWHPERFPDPEDKLSKAILNRFREETNNNQN